VHATGVTVYGDRERVFRGGGFFVTAISEAGGVSVPYSSADARRAGKVRPRVIEGQMPRGYQAEDDGHALRSPALSVRGVSLTMRKRIDR
jgi:hypothetical protein